MVRFHRLNQAYRNHDGEYLTFQESNENSVEPLINYAFYAGQGFGRVIEHTSLHCILALALNRPCVIDMDDRDAYYTWRSFIWRGSYDWEMVGSPAEKLRYEVQKVTSPITKKEIEDIQTLKYVELMVQPSEWKSKTIKPNESMFWVDIQRWRPENITKALLSPNWGNSWFDNLVFPSKIGGCPLLELQAYMQNSLYQPTPLTHKLFQERQHAVLTNSSPEMAPTGHPLPTYRYGAIHIRTEILQLGKNLKTKFPAVLKEFVDLMSANASAPNVTEWWIVADEPATAVHFVEQLQLLHGNNDRLHFVHGYSSEEAKSTQLRDHSFSEETRGLFKHEKMASSILDWMVLWQSSIAVVTVGAFGNTGAQGNNKLQRHEMYKTLRAYW
ncbi:hypothetical protein ACA910_006652 [Epithemia clementina (nom. ined.)]